jgi:uncharacterized protein YybS (DUF2232 family)
MKITRELRDLTAASTVAVLLFAAGALLPLIGPAAGFFSATPLIWLAARHGTRPGLLGALLATALLLPAFPPPVALVFALEHAGPACWLGARLRTGRGVVAGSAAAALVVALLAAGAALLFVPRDADPLQLLERQLRTGLTEIGTATGDRGAADRAAELEAEIVRVLPLLRRILPALTLIGIFLEFALTSLLAARLLSHGAAGPPPPDLAGFALPERLVWVLIATLALCWAPQPQVTTVALNALLPLLLGYLMQGLSICVYFATRARL